MPANKTSFRDALQERDLNAIRSIPKSDLHNHCMLGGKASVLNRFYGEKLQPFRADKMGIEPLNRWIGDVYAPFMKKEGAFEKAVEAAFIQAKQDGVKVLEMSMDGFFGSLFNISPERAVGSLKHYHSLIAPEIDFRPELGFPKTLSLRIILKHLEPFLGFNYFRSIDLYDDENAQPLENFRELYRFARNAGLKLKAHAGEFGDADSVRKAVEILGLEEVQHGIGAAASPEVMRWLASNSIRLNVCPESNIRLKRVKSYKTHPIRILFDHGVKVTVNSDDVLLFRAGVSEQFLKLHRSGLFSTSELDTIRLNGLS
ncbi:MAG: adenosine deaminase [Bacteroidetes bacterium]|nr:adenosine deaminase [Bacteroidota bacterium]